MYRLRLFGGFAIFGPSGASLPGVANRRAEAVLAMLALGGDVGCARSQIIALLWPEHDEELARHNLRNALYAIRHHLDADVIENVGDRLRLNARLLEADVEQFVRAFAEQRMQDAVAAYRGSLLDGFHVERAAEFERWVGEQRTRLHRECAEALETLAQQAAGVTGPQGGVAWWMRMTEHEPYSSRVAVKLIRALVSAGDSAAALRYADEHRRRLIDELEVEPSGQFEEEVARIRAACAPGRGQPLRSGS